MPEPFERTALVPSVLDRLTNLEQPGVIGSLRPGSMAALYTAIQRDLGALLNTRRQEDAVPAGFEQAAASLANFGIPDLTLYSLRMPADQNRLRRSIEVAVRTFEPRLSNISVVIEGWDEAKPILRFRVEATLKISPVPEPVVFDTEFRVDSGRFQTKARRR